MLKSRKSVVSIFIVCILVVSTLLVGGCSDDDSNPLLRVNLGENPATLDPQKAMDAADISVAIQMFDGLLGFNQDLTLKPVVAKEVPSVENGGISQDGLTYTFNFHEDVTWSDGQPVTADDFVYSITRLCTYGTQAYYRATYLFVINNALQYYLDTRDNPDQTPSVELGVKAIDDYTLEITLAEPTPSFLQRMALWAVYPLRQDVIEANGDDWANSPKTNIGNGPFILKEWVTDDHITLERNPNYWGTPAKLEGVRYAMYEDAATEYLAYRAGDLDITRLPVGTERTVANSSELVSYPRLKTNALFFDNGESPFNNTKLRQALAMAIDRSALVDKLQGGRGSITYCWIPAGMPGYASTYQETCGSQFAFDASGAAQLLEEALEEMQIDELPDITLIYANAASNSTIASFIQGQLETNLEITVETVGVGTSTFWGRVFGEHDKWDLAYLSFSADYADPDNWLPDFFGTSGGYADIGLYSSTDFDDKVAEALAEANDTQRLALWQEAEAIMVEDAPAIFLFNDEMFVLKKDHVKGLVGTAMDLRIPGDQNLAEMYLD